MASAGRHLGLSIYITAMLFIRQMLAGELPNPIKASFNDKLGTVFFIYDSTACDCILTQNAMMRREIDSVMGQSHFRAHWSWRELEYNRSRIEAERLLKLCTNPLLPATIVLLPNEELIFEASSLLIGNNLARTLELLISEREKEKP